MFENPFAAADDPFDALRAMLERREQLAHPLAATISPGWLWRVHGHGTGTIGWVRFIDTMGATPYTRLFHLYFDHRDEHGRRGWCRAFFTLDAAVAWAVQHADLMVGAEGYRPFAASEASLSSMCGRFVMAKAGFDIAAALDASPGDHVEDFQGSWNIAPTTRVPIAVEVDGVRRLELARWGLVPRWAADEKVGVRAINARSETAAEKPTFRDAVRSRRAVIPADGYYEWQKHADGSKTPFYIHAPEALTLFAGLYEWWRDPAGRWLLSTSILTRAAAGGRMREIHDRMPILLDRGEIGEWLGPSEHGDVLVDDFAQRAESVAQGLAMHPVDARVGRVSENDPRLIEPDPRLIEPVG